jgi:hypothetical protein
MDAGVEVIGEGSTALPLMADGSRGVAYVTLLTLPTQWLPLPSQRCAVASALALESLLSVLRDCSDTSSEGTYLPSDLRLLYFFDQLFVTRHARFLTPDSSVSDQTRFIARGWPRVNPGLMKSWSKKYSSDRVGSTLFCSAHAV